MKYLQTYRLSIRTQIFGVKQTKETQFLANKVFDWMSELNERPLTMFH